MSTPEALDGKEIPGVPHDDFTYLRKGPGDYDYGDQLLLPEHLWHEKVFQSDFWKVTAEVLAGSFFSAGGMQDEQFCDQVAAGMQLVEEGEITIDPDMLHDPLVVEAVGSWKLPPSHTIAPLKVDGLVSGIYLFWLAAQEDAMRLVTDPDFQLPGNRELNQRFRDRGVPLYRTSSTKPVELHAIHASYDALRNDPAAASGSMDDFLLKHALAPHLQGILYWGTYNRPRRDGGDRHEALWLTAISMASEKSAEDRTFYERLLVRKGRALQHLLSMTRPELAEHDLVEVRETHDAAVDLLNESRPEDEQIDTLLDGIDLPGQDRPMIYLPPRALLEPIQNLQSRAKTAHSGPNPP